MRDTFVKSLCDLAADGVDLHLFTGDLGFKVLDPFREQHPSRFTNVGAAEANMVTLAAGMAMTGKRVFCYSMVPFLMMRAYEQVRLDVCYQKLPVTLLGIGGGLSYGYEGASHFAIEDISMARSLPGLRVIAPGDPVEAEAAIKQTSATGGPVYIRLGKNRDPLLHQTPIADISRAQILCGQECDITLVATGHILNDVYNAAQLLTDKGHSVRVVSFPQIKPLDRTSIEDIARSSGYVFSIEEHSCIGGLGTAVAEILLETGYTGRFHKLGLPDSFGGDVVGTREYLIRHHGLDSEGLVRQIEHFVAAGSSSAFKSSV